MNQLLSAIAGKVTHPKASDGVVGINEKTLPTHTIRQWAKERAKDVAENERINSRWRSGLPLCRAKSDEL